MKTPHTTASAAPSFIILVVLASPASTVSAGVGVWTSGGPDTGYWPPWPSIPRPHHALRRDGQRDFQVHRSGGTWAAANTGLYEPLRLRPGHRSLDPFHALRRLGGGVFKSTDAGGTWTAPNAGLTSRGVHALAIDPATPSTLYAGTGGGVFKSTDSGGTWAAAKRD